MSKTELSSVKNHYRKLSKIYSTKANPRCDKAFRSLIYKWTLSARSILELGGGSSDLIVGLKSELKITTDLSWDMLLVKPRSEGLHRVAADASELPFKPNTFEVAFSINLLEHVSEPEQVCLEARRVLKKDGLLLMITPNGNADFILNLIEKLKMKLPEGPHRFLCYQELSKILRDGFDILVHKKFLAFPVGPVKLVRFFDFMALGWGLFQYIICRKSRRTLEE